jgi:hypothetical protein
VPQLLRTKSEDALSESTIAWLIDEIRDVRSEVCAMHKALRNPDTLNHAAHVLGVGEIVQMDVDR